MKKNKLQMRGLKRRSLAAICLLPLALIGCGKKADHSPANNNSQPSAASGALDGEQIVERFRALDTGRDSTMRLRVKIENTGGAAETPNPGEIQMTIYRKRMNDLSVAMLVEFTAPAQERDRSALVTLSPRGSIEATRYAQSGGTFVSALGVTGEDSLFGMTLQELADGQVEKYTHRLIGEETFGQSPVYKVEGKLKPDSESKFSRLVMLISKESFLPLVAEFYDNHDEMLRRVVVDKVERIDNHWTRMKWTVENRARKKNIFFEAVSAKYDQGLSDSLFSREHLKKISSK